MPHYEFYCRPCKKSFSQILRLVDYEEGDVVWPHCGSREVETTLVSDLCPRVSEKRVEGSLMVSGVTRIMPKHMGDIASHRGWTRACTGELQPL